MVRDESKEVHDLLILFDISRSPDSEQNSLNESIKTSLTKTVSVLNIIGGFAQIGLLASRVGCQIDLHGSHYFEWSNWHDYGDPKFTTAMASMLGTAAQRLKSKRNKEFPEGVKADFAQIHALMRESVTTVILLYTDAPQPCWVISGDHQRIDCLTEKAVLNTVKPDGSVETFFEDCVSLCKELRFGLKKVIIFSFLDDSLGLRTYNLRYYTYLSTVTLGACIILMTSKSHSIAQIIVNVLLVWMGAEKAGAKKITMQARLARFKDDVERIKSAKRMSASASYMADVLDATDLEEVQADSEVLEAYLPKKITPIRDFTRLYAEEETYRAVLAAHLKETIQVDVDSMSLNPILGTLWRLVLNDCENPARDDLMIELSRYIKRVNDADAKTRMKSWLEDNSTEILEVLETVPEELRVPCVFFDPTTEFDQTKEEDEQEDGFNEKHRLIASFSRAELLEIESSRDSRVLQRFGKILTRLTFITSEVDLLVYISSKDFGNVPRIPFVLASKKYSWKFWEILLHTVLPGTMLSIRSATVLAALSIRMGIKPLFDPARAMMLFWRDNHQSSDESESWNSRCLELLLGYENKQQKLAPLKSSDISLDPHFLLYPDYNFFSQVVLYQHCGIDLHSGLKVDLGWTPDKTQLPIGPIVICHGCRLPRSVTIMVENSGGRCGLCVADGWTDSKHKARAINANVSQRDTEGSKATWVECAVRNCRAQYVCYNPSDLNIRPKCHYCRDFQINWPAKTKPAPTLECTKCLSKVIWPNEYRITRSEPYECVACLSGYQTIITTETSVDQVTKENGSTWLNRNGWSVFDREFRHGILYHIVSVNSHGHNNNIGATAASIQEPVLTLQGKRIHDQAAVSAKWNVRLQPQPFQRQVCGLCFGHLESWAVHLACRRPRCHERICTDCLNKWYKLNGSGKIINTLTLFCPFCRRRPAASVLAAYSNGIHAVVNVQDAVEDSQKWIYAWCCECGKAKRYIERDYAKGAPEAVSEWKCELCLAASERILTVEAKVREVAEQATESQLESAERLRTELELPTKKCPNCKKRTQKTAGFNHMVCSKRNCGANWCWLCVKDYGETGIYPHMSRYHRGWYAGGEDATGDEDQD